MTSTRIRGLAILYSQGFFSDEIKLLGNAGDISFRT